ncbi:glycerophosphodiester phosphodiesterase [Roseomonas elaeocarpi]|uniref:Glycerophosphodiester phosphodiesterase n=1 Tax=Roseomonas elaeocarpi TaxID=907779 RepID=A0ABV6JLV5_9PROT
MPSMPLIVAHRGCSALHRENSPAAWDAAVVAGADYVEVDLRVSGDGVVVCCHDADLRRLIGRSAVVAETSARDLATLFSGGHPAAPPLDMLFASLPGDVPLLFDIKDERSLALDVILQALAQYSDREMLLGLHAPASVGHVRAAGWSRHVLGFLKPGNPAAEESFFDAGGDVLRIWEWDATAGRLQREAAAGRPAWITMGEGNTGRRVGDHGADALLRMAEEGAAAFLVNDPLATRRVLAGADAELR